MATITAAAGGGNWNSTTTWTGGVVPTLADDVVIGASSGNVTVTADAFCRSLDCTGYTGTLTHNASAIIFIGTSTPGTGNSALKLSSGMTYTYGSTSTSQFAFTATTATQQSITTAGKTLPLVNFNGPGGSWILADSLTSVSTLIIQQGTVATNGQAVSISALAASYSTARSIALGASVITITGGSATVWDTSTTTNLAFDAGTSSIVFSGTSAVMSSGALTFYNVSFTGLGTPSTPATACTFNNLSRTGTAVRGDTWALRANVTVTGTFTVNGNSSINRVLVYSSPTASATGATAWTVTAAAVSASNADFMDITAAGAANWNLSAITGGSGDCLGNTGITFTTAAPQTWQGTTGGNWSDVTKWTSRVPLPQDDVTVGGAWPANTITWDMARLGRDIDFSSATGSLVINPNTNTTLYGSLNLTGVATMGASNASLAFGGRGSHTVRFAGLTLNKSITFIAPGGTYAMQDTATITGTFNVYGGTLLSQNNTINCSLFWAVNLGATVSLGSSTVNMSSTAANYIFVQSNNALVTTSAGCMLNITSASTNTRKFICSNLGNATLNYTVSGSTGALLFDDASITLYALNFSDSSNPRTLTFTSNKTYTFTEFNVSAAAGRVVTINTTIAGTLATLKKTSGYVSTDYLSIQDCNATGGASWYAGSNSTIVSNSTGWFLQPYSSSRFMELM